MDPGVSRAFLGKDDGGLLSEELMENWREMEILPNSVVDNIITLSRVLGDLEYISTPQYLFVYILSAVILSGGVRFIDYLYYCGRIRILHLELNKFTLREIIYYGSERENKPKYITITRNTTNNELTIECAIDLHLR